VSLTYTSKVVPYLHGKSGFTCGRVSVRAMSAQVGAQEEGISTPSGLSQLQISLLGCASQATQEDTEQLITPLGLPRRH